MARQVAVSIENNFKAGLITEASGLNYPENSCIETSNCIFDSIGRVSRRPGFDFENGFVLKTIDRTSSVISSYLWRNVTGDGTYTFAVVQVGNTLYFYNASLTTTVSGGIETGTIDLTTYSPATAPAPKTAECGFTDGAGKLFVTHPFLESFYVVYTPATDTFAATQINPKIRDFEGLDESSTATDNRPATNSDIHKYNLYNQGWTDTQINAWDAARTDFPSNADVWWTFKNASDAFDTSVIANVDRGNTFASKGHFLLGLYNQDRNTASGLSGLLAGGTSYNRPSTCAFFAGRLFFSGIAYPGFNSKIYFSQIVTRDSQYSNTYQANDPTSETLFDLEVDDGGVINIPEAGSIYKLFPMQSALVVFAYRGVWVISGSAGIGFSATDYTVAKVSNYRTVSPTSFVEVNGVPIWWTTDGIYTVSGNANSLAGLTVTPMTFNTIQTFYDAIPNASKLTAKGFFNLADQTVNWLYRSTSASIPEDVYSYDMVLTLNILTGSWSNWALDHTNVSVHALIATDALTGLIVESQVIDDAAENVVDDAGDLISSFALTNTAIVPKFKYLCSYPNAGSWKFTWAEARDTNYKDWNSYDSVGVNFTSYFITGYKIHADAQRKWQPNYTLIYHEGVGECTIRGIWDYANTSTTGRYSSIQTLIFANANYNNAHKRIKIRGQGYSLQYYVSSVTGQPFTIIGWSTQESANATV